MKFGMEGTYITMSSKHEFRENLKSYGYRRNFVINIWRGVGQNRPWVLGTLICGGISLGRSGRLVRASP